MTQSLVVQEQNWSRDHPLPHTWSPWADTCPSETWLWRQHDAAFGPNESRLAPPLCQATLGTSKSLHLTWLGGSQTQMKDWPVPAFEEQVHFPPALEHRASPEGPGRTVQWMKGLNQCCPHHTRTPTKADPF